MLVSDELKFFCNTTSKLKAWWQKAKKPLEIAVIIMLLALSISVIVKKFISGP
jgi:hypothetical protein